MASILRFPSPPISAAAAAEAIYFENMASVTGQLMRARDVYVEHLKAMEDLKRLLESLILPQA